MSRLSQGSRGIVLTALVGGGLLLAGCTPPMPPDVLAARAEAQITCGSGNVDVAVPDEFVGVADSVGMALTSVCADQTVTEVPITDPAPVAIVGQTPSDQVINDFQAASCPTDSVIVIPAFAYPVTMAYNVIGLEGLVFTPEIVAGILSGSITSWEDPAIVVENPDFDLTLLPDITLMSVETPQGSVEAMTSWIVQQSPSSWPQGVVSTLEVGEKFPTQADLIAEMVAVEGSMAVLPIFTAFTELLATANFPVKGTDENGQEVDTVITSDDVQLYKVGSGATTVTVDDAGNIFASPAVGGFPTPGNFDLASSKIVLAEGAGLVGWPVEGYAHALICDDGNDQSLPLLFAQYMVRLAGQGSLETFGVTPLPEPIRVQTFTPLRVTVQDDGISEDGAVDNGTVPDEAGLEEDIVDEEDSMGVTGDEVLDEETAPEDGQ